MQSLLDLYNCVQRQGSQANKFMRGSLASTSLCTVIQCSPHKNRITMQAFTSYKMGLIYKVFVLSYALSFQTNLRFHQTHHTSLHSHSLYSKAYPSFRPYHHAVASYLSDHLLCRHHDQVVDGNPLSQIRQ